MSRIDFPAELFLPHLNADRSIPQYLQLFRVFERNILDATLVKGAKLPASRPLAQSLGVSRNTVKTAFELLQAEGYIETRPGAGSFVADISSSLPHNMASVEKTSAGFGDYQLSDLAHSLASLERPTSRHSAKNLAPAMPSLNDFPWMQWQRCVSFAGRSMKHNVSDNGMGSELLRRQLAAYLQVVRGVKCSADNILITAGSQQGVYLSLQLLLNAQEGILVEEPCYFGIEGAISAIGANKIAVGVDQQGFNLQPAQYDLAKLALVTPSRNYPLGHTMSAQRRLDILHWSKVNSAWIIEDDYDSEFRFDGPPLTALQGLGGHENVIYSGTFSRILHPSIRLGYLVLPDVLVDHFCQAKRLVHGDVSILPQLALADFMSRGYFSSHVRRMRKLYHLRRQSLQSLIAEKLPADLTLLESDGGMHCVYLLADKYSDQKICEQAMLEGVAIKPLSSYYTNLSPRQGLVIGFAGYDLQAQREGIAVLQRVFERYSQ